MPITEAYRKQVELLVRTIPHIAEEECFALKGGTAINLFVRDLPRLSVDIDLTYLPVKGHDESLEEIDAALRRIGARVKNSDSTKTVTQSSPGGQNAINKLVVRTRDRVQIKVEVTPVLRGCVYEPQLTPINERAEEEFGFVEINMLSFADLYAGKIAAALDRQHPRDLFDVHLLLENEGISDDLLSALVIYLASHDKSPHVLLGGECRNIAHDYENNFHGMTEVDIPMAMLIGVHANLRKKIIANLPKTHQEFLASFYRRQPNWSLLGLGDVDQLPAIKWRELNLDKAGAETREGIASNFEALFDGNSA